MQKITPYLWFDSQAEEAMNYYCSIFPNSRPGQVTRYGEGMPELSGKVMMTTFNLNGQDFMALNGGPKFTFTEAVSFLVFCDSQDEVDAVWDKMIADGGEEGQCGWLKDKFGLSWQIIPESLSRLMSDPDPAKSKRVMQAMLQMKKIETSGLQKAYDGK